MEIKKLCDAAFRKYGRVITDCSCDELITAMEATLLPDGVVYVPSVPELEALPVYEELKDRIYGELPIQIGYCNGDNHKLNALEYHRSSEINVACTDLILLLGMQQDIDPQTNCYDTAAVEAFLVPKGTMLEVYATTLHYAPCSAGGKFRCVVVLPKDTNLPLEKSLPKTGEYALITAKNKWLIGHPESGLEKEGAFIGLQGENLTV